MADLSEQSPLIERTGDGPITVPSERSTRSAEAVLPAAPSGDPSNLKLAVIMSSIWVSRSPYHENNILKPCRLVLSSHLLVSKVLEQASSYPCFHGKSVLVKLRYSQIRRSLPRSLFPSHHLSPH